MCIRDSFSAIGDPLSHRCDGEVAAVDLVGLPDLVETLFGDAPCLVLCEFDLRPVAEPGVLHSVDEGLDDLRVELGAGVAAEFCIRIGLGERHTVRCLLYTSDAA